MSHVITIRLNKELAVWLEQAAAKTGVSLGQLIRDQLEKTKASEVDEDFLNDLREELKKVEPSGEKKENS